jgi:hypothetical protein
MMRDENDNIVRRDIEPRLNAAPQNAFG